MNDISPTFVTSEQQVTSSDLVRQFGVWQDRAARAPVYILHRGRPRLVLVSMEIMDALCTPHGAEEGDGATLAAVIDAYEEAVLLFDRAGRVLRANRAARTRFAAAARIGSPAAALSRASGAFLEDAVARVITTGTGETLDLVPDRHPSRRLLARVDALPEGCMLVARDATAAEELRARDGEARALAAAVEATGTGALARINPRGFLVAPGEALARMTGATTEQLAAARFLTLFAVADRPALGDLIERVFATGVAASGRAGLLVRGATERPATLGLAGVERGGRVEEVIATLSLS